MPISAKWKHKSSIHIGFIVFNGGVTTFFAKSVDRPLASVGEMKKYSVQYLRAVSIKKIVVLAAYGFHSNDKTVSQSHYLFNGNPIH